MLKYLKLENIGPADQMELELGSRLNILTGDNGLGKSFLLDVAWFVNTGSWPRDVNPGVVGGYMARPRRIKKEAKISSRTQMPYTDISTGERTHSFDDFVFEVKNQKWGRKGNWPPGRRPTIYFMADGSVAIWDDSRNFYGLPPRKEESEGQKAFVFSPEELWRGKEGPDRKRLIHGLIGDWATWQKENGENFRLLVHILDVLSPEPSEHLRPGELTRIDVNDLQDMPTIVMPYGEEVPIVHAAAGIRRILSLAYVLVWMWTEHQRAAKLFGENPTLEITFLLDEVECHLSPKWQRKILPALMEAVKELSAELTVQLIANTHSPLVMASLEPLFNPEQDRWFDLDMDGENGHQTVKLQQQPFYKLGGAEEWLTSVAFDLDSTRSLPAEKVLFEVEQAMNSEGFDHEQAKVWSKRLAEVLPEDDEFFTRWRYVGQKQGWLK